MTVSAFKILILLVILSSTTKGDLFSEFEERLDRFVVETSREDECDVFNELIRLYLQDDGFCVDGLMGEVRRINEHTDGVDFSLHSMGWILTHFWDSPMISNEMKENITDAVTNIPLFLSYPGELNNMQYWSENHQIGWYAAEYIIGSAFSNRPELSSVVFPSSGKTGKFHADAGRHKLVRWLNFRLKYGFSEFNSDTYAPIAYKALVSVVGCAPDQDVRDLATIVMNLQLYDHLLGSHGLKLATARGRAYSEGKWDSNRVYGHMWLFKGVGSESQEENEIGSSQSVYFSLCVLMGRYKVPLTLLQIAKAVEEETELYEERFGLGEYEGEVDVEDAENCTFWLGNGGYFSPVHPRCLFVIGDAYDLWDRTEIWGQVKIAKPIWDLDPFIVDTAGELGSPLGHGPVLGPANMRTFRSNGLMLSSLQNYKGGYMAGQQHAWQATLDTNRNGTVFSIQPTDSESSDEHSSEYWVGGILPRTGQFGSTLISMYSPEVLNTAVFGIKLTHAHFDYKQFDEFSEVANADGSTWLIGRQGDAYVALYSWQGGKFQVENNGLERDFVSEGVQNVYICEVGSKQLNQSYDEFYQAIVRSDVQVRVSYNDSLLECLVDNQCLSGIPDLLGCLLGVCRTMSEESFSQNLLNAVQQRDSVYTSSILGKRLNEIRKSDVEVEYRKNQTYFQFGWDRPLTVDGLEISLDNFPRYNNKFGRMEWKQRNISIQTELASLYMDFDDLTIVENEILLNVN